MKEADLITEAEYAMLSQGDKTPAFYGLPKLHSVKAQDVFPPLRPICSGSESCTKRLSEFLDRFLKAAARKLEKDPPLYTLTVLMFRGAPSKKPKMKTKL